MFVHQKLMNQKPMNRNLVSQELVDQELVEQKLVNKKTVKRKTVKRKTVKRKTAVDDGVIEGPSYKKFIYAQVDKPIIVAEHGRFFVQIHFLEAQGKGYEDLVLSDCCRLPTRQLISREFDIGAHRIVSVTIRTSCG